VIMLVVAAIILASGMIIFTIVYYGIIHLGKNKSKEGINANYWHEYSENPYNSYTKNEYSRIHSQDDACN